MNDISQYLGSKSFISIFFNGVIGGIGGRAGLFATLVASMQEDRRIDIAFLAGGDGRVNNAGKLVVLVMKLC
ncbi:hypothetical protein M433DRAFT_283954 [Acidomyces richmondensis BFW]|nr:MAG: hypothetical protein FE78DRAFT_466084 [Acidomyces sp. 'richmondensis']KYG49598.1 hypothetical protein M433DRAFT_283954 [Acidomyces richmondensis BFW]